MSELKTIVKKQSRIYLVENKQSSRNMRLVGFQSKQLIYNWEDFVSAWMPEAFGVQSLPSLLLMNSVIFFPVKGIRKQLCFPDFLLIDW